MVQLLWKLNKALTQNFFSISIFWKKKHIDSFASIFFIYFFHELPFFPNSIYVFQIHSFNCYHFNANENGKSSHPVADHNFEIAPAISPKEISTHNNTQQSIQLSRLEYDFLIPAIIIARFIDRDISRNLNIRMKICVTIYVHIRYVIQGVPF